MEALGAINSMREIFGDFQAGPFIGFCGVCYLIIQVLRGKAGFSIPFVTLWLEQMSKEVKTAIILTLFAIAGGVSSLASESVTIWVVLDGLLAGLAAGFTTLGVRNGTKQSIEGISKLKKNMKDAKNSKVN